MSQKSAYLFVFHLPSNVFSDVEDRSICHAAPHHLSVFEYLTSVPLTPFTDMCGRGCGLRRKICGRWQTRMPTCSRPHISDKDLRSRVSLSICERAISHGQGSMHQPMRGTHLRLFTSRCSTQTTMPAWPTGVIVVHV